MLFYISYSTDGLPLGWDTPYYIWRIHSATASGISAFAISARYYDFLYPAIGSLISLAGLDPFSTELTIPLFLWIIGMLTIVAIVRREMSDAKSSLIALGAGSTWFGLFRLSSDLDANLLGLVLMLGGTWVFLQTQTEARPRQLAFKASALGGIIILSSLSHIETTIFISTTWVLALILSRWRSLVSVQRFAIMLATISLSLVPGVFIFWVQQQWVAGLLQGRLPSISAMSPLAWLLYLGPIGLVCLITIPVILYLKQLHISSRIATLTFSWLFLSLTIGLAQYLNHSITPFSERAVILTPTPFLAAIIIPRLGNFKVTSQLKGVALISLVMVGGSTLYYADIGHQFYNSFISDSASASLHYLQSSGMVDLKRSIFIVSDPPDERGIGEHNSLWVGAYLGDHYTYLGRVDFLMAGLETPFTDDQSAQISSVLSSSGGWYWTAQPWARSGSSLQLNLTHPNQVAMVSEAFAAPQNANYNVTLRIWDGAPSNPILIMLDGENVDQLTTHGTYAAVNATVFNGYLTKGVHTLTLAVDDQPSVPQYVSLDYISIEQ